MEFIAYIAALLIGITLGLIGGGGSIVTVPVMVYLLGINPVLSTAYSLFIVGFSSLVGSLNNLRKGLVDLKTAIIFSIPSFISVYLTRLYLVPLIPEKIESIFGLTILRGEAIMLLFAGIMFFSAMAMIKPKKGIDENSEVEEKIKYNYPVILIEGLIVGTLTGLVGAGGGFLIIPALVLFARLPMKLAIGTSLLIIAFKSLIGFLGDIQSNQNINWHFLLQFTSLSIIGIFIGGKVSNYIDNKYLKKGFGWFVLLMSLAIITKELILK